MSILNKLYYVCITQTCDTLTGSSRCLTAVSS